MSPSPPLLLFLLLPTLALLTTSLGLLIHALTSFHYTQSTISHLTANFPSAGASGISVSINASDIEHTGIVLGVGCGLGMIGVLAILAYLCLRRTLTSQRVDRADNKLEEKETADESTSKRSSADASAYNSLPLLTLPLLLSSALIFSTVVPFTYFYATREARVVARLGHSVISPEAVKQVEKSLGLTGVYREVSYLKPAVILPWLALLFTLTTALTLLSSHSPLLSTPADTAHAGLDIHTGPNVLAGTPNNPKPDTKAPPRLKIDDKQKVTPGNSSFGNRGSGLGTSAEGSPPAAPAGASAGVGTGAAVNGAPGVIIHSTPAAILGPGAAKSTTGPASTHSTNTGSTANGSDVREEWIQRLN
jgi:hypothetical protein